MSRYSTAIAAYVLVSMLPSAHAAMQLRQNLEDCERYPGKVDTDFCIGSSSGSLVDEEQACNTLNATQISACAASHKLQSIVGRVVALNHADVWIQISYVVIFAGLVYWIHIGEAFTARGSSQDVVAGVFLSVVLFFGFLLAIAALGIQIAVLVDAFAVHSDNLIGNLRGAGCLNYAGAEALIELGESLKAIRFLGILELILKVLQIGLDFKVVLTLFFDVEGEKWFGETSVGSFIADFTVLGLEVAMTLIDYFVFTLDLHAKAADLFQALAKGSADTMVSCVVEDGNSGGVGAVSDAFALAPSGTLLTIALCVWLIV